MEKCLISLNFLIFSSAPLVSCHSLTGTKTNHQKLRPWSSSFLYFSSALFSHCQSSTDFQIFVAFLYSSLSTSVSLSLSLSTCVQDSVRYVFFFFLFLLSDCGSVLGLSSQLCVFGQDLITRRDFM